MYSSMSSRKRKLNYAYQVISPNLQDYGKLKRVALGVIAHSLTPAEIRTLRAEFQNVDVEGRGEISPMDLKNALNKSDNYTDEEVDKLFEQMDVDQDGTIGTACLHHVLMCVCVVVLRWGEAVENLSSQRPLCGNELRPRWSSMHGRAGWCWVWGDLFSR